MKLVIQDSTYILQRVSGMSREGLVMTRLWRLMQIRSAFRERSVRVEARYKFLSLAKYYNVCFGYILRAFAHYLHFIPFCTFEFSIQ